MISFSQHLTEDKGGKNLHLEHIEDEILNFGVSGGRAAINFVRSLRDMLAGSSRSSVNTMRTPEFKKANSRIRLARILYSNSITLENVFVLGQN